MFINYIMEAVFKDFVDFVMVCELYNDINAINYCNI